MKNHLRLKDYPYEIKGNETKKHFVELAVVISLSLFIPLAIAIVIRLADEIDSIDNFYVAYGIGLLIVFGLIYAICRKR